MNRITKSISDLDSKLNKLYQFDKPDAGNRLPISRNILDYLNGNTALLKAETESIDNDIGSLKQQFSKLDDDVDQDLDRKFDKIQSQFIDKSNSLNLFKQNIDSYEEEKISSSKYWTLKHHA